MSQTLDRTLSEASSGDAAAFVHLYDGLAPRAYGLVLRILRDPHQAEEVTQEVFVEAWQTAQRFDSTLGSADSWLLTLAHRRSVDRIRSEDSRRRRDAAYAQHVEQHPYDQTAASAHASMTAQAVRSALATLSPSHRQALELAYFGGLTHTEVSELLAIPLGTAKGRIRSALLRLREALVAGGFEPGP